MNKQLKICGLGDISFAYFNVEDKKRIVSDELYKKITDNDVIIANMEYVVANNYSRTNFLCLVETPQTISILCDLGVNVVSLANNHVTDYGLEGITTTINVLKSRDINYCGAGKNEDEAKKPCFVEKNGVKIAVFGRVLDDSFVNIRPIIAGSDKYGAAELTEKDIDECIKKYRSKVDLMIMYVHWGMQGMNSHSQKVEYYGNLLKRKGFDIIFGSHSHIPGGGKNLIYYGLGNFYFTPIPCKGNFDGLLYGPRYKRNRVSEAVFIKYNLQTISEDILFVYQDVDEVIKIFPLEAQKRYIKMIFNKTATYSYFNFQMEWRIRIIGVFIDRINLAFENNNYKRLLGLFSKGLIRLIMNLITPKTLG